MCGVVAAPLLLNRAANNSATAQEGAALLPLIEQERAAAPGNAAIRTGARAQRRQLLVSTEPAPGRVQILRIRRACSTSHSFTFGARTAVNTGTNPQQRMARAKWLVTVLRSCGFELHADENEVWLLTRVPLSAASRAAWRDLSAEVHAVVLAGQAGAPERLCDHPAFSAVGDLI